MAWRISREGGLLLIGGSTTSAKLNALTAGLTGSRHFGQDEQMRFEVLYRKDASSESCLGNLRDRDSLCHLIQPSFPCREYHHTESDASRRTSKLLSPTAHTLNMSIVGLQVGLDQQFSLPLQRHLRRPQFPLHISQPVSQT